MAVDEVALGALTLQPGRQLLADGRPLPLGRKALDILSVLAGAGGEVVTKDELMNAVWPGIIVEENAIQVHVAALRKALGDEADRLTTVRGIGYRLDIPKRPKTPAPRGVRPRYTSLAVLPFANLTGDRAKDYLGDGIARELASTLAQASDLKIPSWMSSYYHRDRAADIRTIARQLGVECVLEGWVKSDADRFRISVQLIDAASGFHIWAESYDRRSGGLPALEEEIVAAISRALCAKLHPLVPLTAHAEAFEYYLRARSHINTLAPDALEEAIELLSRAIELDGRFGRALAFMAHCLCSVFSAGARPPSAVREARRFADRAIALDPATWEGHSALAWAALLEGDWSLAETHTGVFDLCPVRAAFLATVGHLHASIVQSEHTLALDPTCTSTAVVCATAHWLVGDHEAALRYAGRAIASGMPASQMPLAVIRSDAAFAAGDHGAAAELLSEGIAPELLAIGAADVVHRCCTTLAGKGSREMAVAALDRFVANAREQSLLYVKPPTAGLVIGFYTRLGALDRAYRIADGLVDHWKAVGVLDQPSVMALWGPDLEPFRRDPRFDNLAARLGLTDFWATHGQPDSAETQNQRRGVA